MKVLIISPPNSFINIKRKKSKSFENRIIPLDLAQIATVLKSKNHQVKIVDGLAGGDSKEEIVQQTLDFNPQLIILSPFDRCRWGLPATVKLLNEAIIKNKRVGILGGYNREFIFDFLSRFPQIQFATFGDPEFTLLKIVDGDNWENIEGVIFQKDNEVHQNGTMAIIQNLDDLPIIDRNLLPMNLYQRFPHEAKTSQSIDIQASRGCPFNCIFCILPQISGSFYRIRSVDNVIREIEELKKSKNNKTALLELHFMDPLFTLKRDWVLEFCNKLKNKNIIWSCQTRADLVDEEILRIMKKAGCFSILYGVESFNPQILETIEKKVSVEKSKEIVRLTQNLGIETRLSLIFGLPGETPEIAKQTIREIIKIDPDFVQFHTAIAFPGTPLYQKASKWGCVEEFENKSFDLVGSPFVASGYKNANEIKKIQEEGYRRFYLRPRFCLKKIVKIKEWPRYFRGVKILIRLIF